MAFPVNRTRACAHCRKVLQKAVQTKDGERLCKKCFEDINRFPGSKCSECNIDASSKCHVDRAAQRSVLSDEVYCSQKDYGCDWVGLMMDYKKQHEETCRYRDMEKCPFKSCGEIVQSILDVTAGYSAILAECEGKAVRYKICTHCKRIPRDAVQTPNGEIVCESCFEQIESYPTRRCDDCGITVEPDKYYVDNAVRKEVKSYTAKCNWGCPWSGTISELEEHLKKCCAAQCSFFGCGIKLPTAFLADHESRCDFRPVQCFRCHDEVPFCRLTDHYKYNQCKGVNRVYDTSPVVFIKLVEAEGADTVMLKPVTTEIPQHSQLGGACIRLLTPAAVVRSSKDMADSHDLYQKTDALTAENAALRQKVNELEQRTDGTILWKITEFSARHQEAMDERISIHSSPFYTARNGYKMCIRAYLNGDGEGYETHVSLFFVIMKSDYDNLLKWPFESKVSIIIADQSTKYRHIVKEACPKHGDQPFKKPEGDMNVAIGFPTFARLKDLTEDYVKDDMLFIKCVVDTTNIFHP